MAPSQPNVLIVIADQWRGDALSKLGHVAARTPVFDRFADQGLMASRAYAQASPCGPARASLLTGLMPERHGVWRNGQEPSGNPAPLFGAFADAGYDVAYLGYTSFTGKVPWPWRDLPGAEGDGKQAYRAHMQTHPELGGVAWSQLLTARDAGEGHILSRPAKLRAEESELAFLAERTGKAFAEMREPFLMHVGLPRPHDPFVARRPFAETVTPASLPPRRAFGAATAHLAGHPLIDAYRAYWPQHYFSGYIDPADPDRLLQDLDDTEIDLLRAAYFALIAEVDAAVGRILDDLEGAGLAERTIVVLTSDHGEYAGDYGLFAKHGFMPEAFHVPLAIRDPGMGADAERGRVVVAPVGAIDIIPTLAARAGVALPPGIDGGPVSLHGSAQPVRSAMDFSHLFEERPDLEHGDTPRRASLAYTDAGYVVGFDRGTTVSVDCDPLGNPLRTRSPTPTELELLHQRP